MGFLSETSIVSAAVEKGTAYFKIVGRIWSWSATDGSKFRTQVDSAISAGVKNAVIEGSSEGGSVFATNNLLAMFQEFDDVKIKVHALMASAFTYLTSHFHTTIKSNTQGMIHFPKVSAGGNLKDIKATLKLVENVTSNYVKAYAAKTGKTEKEIKALMNDGDYWMDAQELLAEGFVDAIEGEVEAFTDFDVDSLAACGAPIIPEAKQKTNKTKNHIMDREELIAFLGLEANATDADIKDAKSAMKVDALKHRATEEEGGKHQNLLLQQTKMKLLDHGKLGLVHGLGDVVQQHQRQVDGGGRVRLRGAEGSQNGKDGGKQAGTVHLLLVIVAAVAAAVASAQSSPPCSL